MGSKQLETMIRGNLESVVQRFLYEEPAPPHYAGQGAVTSAVGDSSFLGFAAGGQHSVLVTAAGEVFTWGDNVNAQLGRTTAGTLSRVPLPLSPAFGIGSVPRPASPRFTVQSPLDANTLVVAVTCETPGATIRYTTDGTEPTEASNTLSGQTITLTDLPITLQARAWISGADSSNVQTQRFEGVSVRAGGQADTSFFCNVAVDSGGGGATSRDNLETACPMLSCFQNLSLLMRLLILQVADHTLAVVLGGSVWSWGENIDGQLGEDPAVEYRDIPTAVAGIENAVAVAGGQYHSLALKADGTVWAWGKTR